MRNQIKPVMTVLIIMLAAMVTGSQLSRCEPRPPQPSYLPE